MDRSETGSAALGRALAVLGTVLLAGCVAVAPSSRPPADPPPLSAEKIVEAVQVAGRDGVELVVVPLVDPHVEDLRERMRLLQGDRKANIDLLETSKTANKETIRKMRAENKELRTELATVKGGKWALGGDDDMEEVQEVKAQVHRLRKQNDDLRHRGAAQAKILEDLKDNVKDLELEARRPNLEDSPLTRKIRMLENQLDKAMIKFNEAQSIKKTYEQIVKRLQDERVGFDNQLAALERTLSAKRKDRKSVV